MEKLTRYAKFIYDEQDEDLIDELESQLNKEAEGIFEFFDPDLERKITTINIIPTKEEYDKLATERRKVDTIPKWEIGTCQEDFINYVSLHDYKNTSHAFKPEEYEKQLEYYKKTIVHEYVHHVARLYLEKQHPEMPIKYLNEGIAQVLSRQRENNNLEFNFTLEDILYGRSCYIGWYMMTKYILEEYGREYFFKLFCDNELARNEAEHIFEEAKEYYNKQKKQI